MLLSAAGGEGRGPAGSRDFLDMIILPYRRGGGSFEVRACVFLFWPCGSVVAHLFLVASPLWIFQNNLR